MHKIKRHYWINGEPLCKQVGAQQPSIAEERASGTLAVTCIKCRRARYKLQENRS